MGLMNKGFVLEEGGMFERRSGAIGLGVALSACGRVIFSIHVHEKIDPADRLETIDISGFSGALIKCCPSPKSAALFR